MSEASIMFPGQRNNLCHAGNILFVRTFYATHILSHFTTSSMPLYSSLGSTFLS